MVRFKVEVMVTGQEEALPVDIGYLSIDELEKKSPSAYEAIVSDSSCVGTYTKTESGLCYRITDRERWNQSTINAQD